MMRKHRYVAALVGLLLMLTACGLSLQEGGWMMAEQHEARAIALSQEAVPSGNTQHSENTGRLFPLDALRGLLIVLMALDHANLLIAHKHPPSEMWGGAFPVYYDALTFLTRLVTHFCAPGFFLLMGAGMALFTHSRHRRGWTRWAVIRHFWIRGAVLIALKFLIVNRGWELSPAGWGIQIYIGVLVALAGTMMLGSLLLWMKPLYLLGVTVVLVIGMELLVPDPSQWGPGMSWPTLTFLVPGGIVDAKGGALLWSNYPILPWLELTTFGMVFGQWLLQDSQKAFNRAWKLGLGFLAVFGIVRALDGFGNIRPRMGNTWMDWLNPVKYPPSIAFTLMTTGVNLLLLWAFSRAGDLARRILTPLRLFGRTPLFFYIVHIFVYVGMGHLLTPNGTSIPAMYPFWLLGLAILFPLCWAYGAFKQRQGANSVLRFL